MNHVIRLMKTIDYELLRKQKLELLEMISSMNPLIKSEASMKVRVHVKERTDALGGIIDMIDAIQDAAVADEFKSEKQVFGEPCEHIYGYDTGRSDPSDLEYEEPGLVTEEEGRCNIRFEFCPQCGDRLKD